MPDIIFEPLRFKNLTVKNRVFRSNISGRLDNYDGSGNQARINWETKFARGGVGAIISSFVPVQIHGRIMPNYATIDRDERIPFWREVGKSVHQYDCKYILQLSHGGRQRDVPGVEFPISQSSTSKADPLHGFECKAMTVDEIQETVNAFAEGARRAREAGLDGVELHGANGYLITQFLSSAINDRTDQYGGDLKGRARPDGSIRRGSERSGALRHRDCPGDSEEGWGGLSLTDEDQRDRSQQRAALPEAGRRRGRQHRRRLGAGLQVAD
jgi:2,4-dienoyl-CoA reductase (NADPH2)